MRRDCLAIALLFSACAAPPPTRPGEVRLALPGGLGPLDGANEPGYGIWAEDLVYDTLLTVGRDGHVRGRLAERWERASTGELRLWMRAGATFSDGTAATPEVVAAALAEPALQVKASGDSLLVQSARAGFPVEALLLTTNVVRKTAAGCYGSGAFVVAERSEGVAVLRRRQPAPGRIEQVRVLANATGREALARVLRGEADLLPLVDGRSVELVDGIERIQVLREPGPYALVVAFGSQRIAPAERRALARAIPAAEVRRAALGNDCAPWPLAQEPGPLPAGRPLDVLVVREDAELHRTGLALRRALGPRGGTLSRVDTPSVRRAMDSGDFDLLIAPLLVRPAMAAATSLHSRSTLAWLGYSSAAADAAIEAGSEEELLRALDRDAPAVFLCTRDRVGVVPARVKNPSFGAWGQLETLPEWELSP